MLNNLNVYGVVIVFNPSHDVLANIKSYIRNLTKLFIYDNSENNNEELFRSLYKESDVEYLYNGTNDGISKSLNTIAKELYCIPKSWLLTMDQDSYFEELALSKMINFAMSCPENTGIISPFHQTVKNLPAPKTIVEERLTVMTSGNLLNVAIHHDVGGFDERYFIDCVDWEYCLKLNSFDYKVLRLNNIMLLHGLGSPIFCKTPIAQTEVVILSHNHIRVYYITRNKLLIFFQYITKYPKVCLIILYRLFSKDLKNIVLYEDDKLLKIYFFIKGIKHFIFRQFGSVNRH